MNTFFPVLTVLLLFANISYTFAQNPILGLWHSKGENGEGIVELFLKEDGKLYGRLLDALDDEKNQHMRKAMNEAGLAEFIILEDFVHKTPNTWTNGLIYSPQRDDKYNCKIELLQDGQLQLTAYFLGFFSKSFVWTRWRF